MQPQFDRINADIKAKRFPEAAAELEAVMDSPAFADLPGGLRHSLISVAGAVQVELHHLPAARALFDRAKEMQEVTANDWFGEADVARLQHDDRAAIVALTEAGRRWPEALVALNPNLIDSAVRHAEELPDVEVRIEFLEVLFDARWKPSAVEPSALWKRLALLLLERNRRDAAAEVASRITSPHQVIAVRADFRFDFVVREHPNRFDVYKALEGELEQLRDARQKEPKSLKAVHRLAHALVAAGRYREVLDLVGEAAAHATDASAYDDAGAFMNWLLNDRADALVALGKWDDAVATFEKASRLEEDGGKNVSQAINLASLLVALDRPKDALRALDGILDLSSYGRMQLELVRHDAALESGDEPAAAKALSFLAGHQQDAMDAYEAALMHSNKLDEAAASLISRLANPARRSAALASLQIYKRGATTPRDMQWTREWERLVARADVQAAIARVGRIECYDIAREGG